ncbi:MAG: TA0956 family protein [Thermoplasmata archaeon]
MVECAMYNLSIGSAHPSTICVVMEKFEDSFESLRDVVESPDQDELMEFISEYARTDTIMPEDKTVGFVVLNSDKKMMSVSFSKIGEERSKNIIKIAETFKDLGYSVDLDMS